MTIKSRAIDLENLLDGQPLARMSMSVAPKA